MTLIQTIGEQLKSAMKSGDTVTRDTLRLLQSAAKNAAIEKRCVTESLTDEDMQEVIRRMVKQRKDSIEQYRAGKREDLATKEESELNILSAYLPQAMPEAELEVIVKDALIETGMTAQSQLGQAMGVAMKRVAGRAPGDAVRRIVEKLLV